MHLLPHQKDPPVTLVSHPLRPFRPKLNVRLFASLRLLQRLYKPANILMRHRQQSIITRSGTFSQAYFQLDPQRRAAVPAQLLAQRSVLFQMQGVGIAESDRLEARKVVDEGESGGGAASPTEVNRFDAAEVRKQLLEHWWCFEDWRKEFWSETAEVKEAWEDGRSEVGREDGGGVALGQMKGGEGVLRREEDSRNVLKPAGFIVGLWGSK